MIRTRTLDIIIKKLDECSRTMEELGSGSSIDVYNSVLSFAVDILKSEKPNIVIVCENNKHYLYEA